MMVSTTFANCALGLLSAPKALADQEPMSKRMHENRNHSEPVSRDVAGTTVAILGECNSACFRPEDRTNNNKSQSEGLSERGNICLLATAAIEALISEKYIKQDFILAPTKSGACIKSSNYRISAIQPKQQQQ